MQHANNFWELNEARLAGEMTLGQQVAWVATIVVLGGAMMVALWVAAR